ncbi:hypothetical protein PR202_gb20646 [Eleusine coracana subsp. coracana]|uniref:non-specific serine/threonine protein kinase n=1 Tax=Eleusine coracana subsp. coracana TaxID=191504 RepID=A0AAV5FB74_ELECO|nr:hypothetical protein PR202_gb20646 [Eleusine coracana subsp. coracana]
MMADPSFRLRKWSPPQRAKLKEAMLVQKLKKYEVAKAQGPTAKPDDLSGQIQEFASEIARLSGGVPVNIIGDNTIVFYRGKNYVQPDVMSPIDTLSKKKNVDLDRDDRKASFVKIEELDQGKDQNDFSDVDIGDISESDEVEEEAAESREGPNTIPLIFTSVAGRLLANLIVMGRTVVGRAMLQAYRQAIVRRLWWQRHVLSRSEMQSPCCSARSSPPHSFPNLLCAALLCSAWLASPPGLGASSSPQCGAADVCRAPPPPQCRRSSSSSSSSSSNSTLTRPPPLRFDYATLTLGSLTLLGDAHLKNGTIRLSRDLPVPTSGAGRALYASAVPLAAGFSTQFRLHRRHAQQGLRRRRARLRRRHRRRRPRAPPAPSSASTPAADAVAVEFDTLLDPQFGDVNGNHVGLDLGSMVSAAAADLGDVGVDLTSGRTVNAWIEYKEGRMEVFVSYAAKRPAMPVISSPVELGMSSAFVGFSASTQGSTEAHAIQWWSFSTTEPPSQPPPVVVVMPPPPPPPPASVIPVLPAPLLPPPTTTTTVTASAPTGSVAAASAPAAAARSATAGGGGASATTHQAAVAGAATAGAVVAASFAGLALWALARRRRRKRAVSAAAATKHGNNGSSSSLAALARSPREFSYKELSAATRGFDASRVIGTGAFGTVYKGIVPDTGAMVAVKRCTNHNANSNNNQEEARSEFLSELSIIAGLRHRNLLRLQGWCHAGGEILLVYDYMRNGSLDRALFDHSSNTNPPLPWRHRRESLAGVASALAYLHHECDRRRTTARPPTPPPAAGTMGYLAPEYLLTGRATEATDVFSFGALVLEVTCGRRPIIDTSTTTTTEARRCNNLVEWVWGLHGEGRVLEAVDPRLGGEFDEGEARRAVLVGLACSSPEPALRPGMRAVVQMLSGEADPPFVPATRPSMTLSSAANQQQLLLSLQDSVSDYNALLGLNLSDDSYSSEDSMSSASLTSALRRGGHDIGFSSTAGDHPSLYPVQSQALEKSKYEQSLETVRRFIAVSEKELELYYRHVALYGTPQSQNVDLDRDDRKASFVKIEELDQGKDQNDFSDVDIGDISESDEVEEEELNQGKDQHDSSDIHVSGISEFDEDDSSSEYNANDDGTEDGISTDEEIVISDRDDLVLPNKV